MSVLSASYRFLIFYFVCFCEFWSVSQGAVMNP